MKNRTGIILAVGLLSLNACSAARPQLYDNQKYTSNPAAAEKAIDDCIARAEKVGAEGEGKLVEAAKRGAKGGIASGAAGAAGAAAAGGNYSIGRSAGASAAAGTAGNLALGLMDEQVDPVFARYVETCLSEKGYKTIGWN